SFSGLQSVQFSKNLAVMGQECFYNCDALTEVTLPATLKTVGKQAFRNCDSLKSATVAGPVCSELMFGECPKLESVTFLDPNCNIYSYSNTVCNEMAAPTRGMYNGVIRGYVGSTAQKYAESWNYRFEPLDPENYVTTSPAITTLPTATTTAVTTTAVTTAAAGKADIGFEISEDAWSFDSDSSSFFRENKAGVYERLLTASDFQTLKDFCSGLDWYGMGGISDHLVEHGNGTCYGMALTALMNHLHMFRPSDLDASVETLKKLTKENETVISAINYHQLLQYRVACQEAIDQGKTDARLFNDLLALAEAGKPAFVILSNDYKDPIKSHAVLAIGCKRYAEKISLNLWDGGHEFNGYIRLYDPTKPHEEVKMYFNQEEHEWYLDNAKFQKCGNWEDNIALRAVFSEWDVLMKGSLFAKPDAAEEVQAQSQLTYQTAGVPNEPEWIDPNTGKPSVGASSANILRKRNVFSINGTGTQLMEKYVADPLYKNDAFRFSFPDQKADSAQVEMRYADTLYYIASDQLRDAVFSPDGVTVSTEKAPYTLRTVRNTAPGSDAICLLSISGSGTGKTEFRQTADGTEWILSTDSPLGIGALEITAESRAGTETKKVLTAAKKICIYAESSGKISVRYEFCKNGDDPIMGPADEAENGDVNFDGAISVEDAQLALRQYTASVAENPDVLPEDNQGKMDVNGDGELSVDDAQLILMYYTQKTVAQKNITWEDLLRQ
ncbi:MAG: leucine-rich repeat protein, partial [Oscillospiraceae bacterium]|nr:leucine-rich repeat protein [Oscillospiraceae bacterium]